MADKRLYIKLDVGYFDNPKIATVNRPTALLLHIASIAYARRHLTDGRVPVDLVIRQCLGAKRVDADTLFDAGLWVDAGGGMADIHDYGEHQQMAEAISAASKRGRSAAHARWNAEGNADGMQNAMPEERRGEERERVARATRIPADFAVTDQMRTWATKNAPRVDLDRETENFRDYWVAKSGKDATKVDWTRTWQKWMRTESDRRGQVTPLRRPATDIDHDAFDAWRQP